MKTKLDLGKIFGIQISIDYTWFIILVLATWGLATEYFPEKYSGLSGPIYGVMGFLSATLLFVSVLLHELSHSYIANRHGLRVERIILFLFGGIAYITTEPQDAKTELKVAVAGPACSLTLAAVFGSLSLIFKHTIAHPILEYLFLVNGALAVFNLIPGYPLDGGRIFRAFLWARTKDLVEATRRARIMGKVFSAFLIVWGIVDILNRNYFGGIWLIFIGIFLQQAAEISYQQVMMKSFLKGVKVKEVMDGNAISVDASLKISQLIEDYFFKYHHDSFPVVMSNKLVGIVSLKDVKSLPKADRPFKEVREIMTKISPDILLHPEEEASNALIKMMRAKKKRLPVALGDQLVGILTRGDIMDLLMVKMNLG